MSALATDDVRSLTGPQLDAIREVANIGAAHAATALSQMLGSTIMISVPRITVARLSEVPPVVAAPEEPVAAVLLHMLGDLSGRTLLVFPRDVASRLAGMMLRRPAQAEAALSDLERSAITEAGNILSSAYLNALSDFMGMVLLPSPPKFTIDRSSSVLSAAHLQFGSDRDHVFCVENEFLMKGDERLRGFFLLLPDAASLNAILRAVRVS
jgi:chemotaxis protein CheC